MPQRRTSLYTVIASQLADEIPSMPGAMFPSQRSLYLRYRVSQGTMKRVVRLLEERGLVRVVAPGRVAIQGRREEKEAVKVSAAENLAKRLRQDIRTCLYRRGQALPKMQSLALEMSVSQHTVMRAYHRLGRENLLHRIGKRWIVGMPDVKLAGAPWKSVLVITERPSSWNSLDRAPRTRAFCMAFSREAQGHKVRQVTACSSNTAESIIPFLRGTPDILGMIRTLGDDLLGVLIAVRRHDMSDMDFNLFIDHFHRLRKPLVWLDSNDEGVKGFHIPSAGQRSRTPWFTRCHFSERSALMLALRRLLDAGHQTIGYLSHGKEPWIAARLGLLHEAADELSKESGRTTTIVSYPTTNLLHNLTDEKGIKDRLDAIIRQGPPAAVKVLQRAMRRLAHEHGPCPESKALRRLAQQILTPQARGAFPEKSDLDLITFASVLCPYLAHPGITAFIAVNDAKAFLYYRYMVRLAIEVPSRYSLISFDNYVPDLPAYPITTVDFGFDDLGYSAFHALARHVPVNRDRQGNIAAGPRLVERGSVRTIIRSPGSPM